MHKPETILKILWDFEIQTDHLKSARQPEPLIVNKIKKISCRIVNFAVSAGYRVKTKENPEKRDKYLDLARELKSCWDQL